MKHAINELQALLDTWGGQKEQSWNDSINDAINVLSAEQHRADMAETSREENANGGPDVVDLVGFAQEIGSQAIQSIVVCGIGAKQCGRTVEEEAALMVGKEIKVWSTVDLDEISKGNFRVFYTEKDDDLGELDPSVACDLSKEGGCESCQ